MKKYLEKMKIRLWKAGKHVETDMPQKNTLYGILNQNVRECCAEQ